MKRQKILILGWDGYIGFPLTLRCIRKGHVVHGVDNYDRRNAVKSIGSVSATDILTPKQRIDNLSVFGDFSVHEIDIIKHSEYLEKLIKRHQFDTIVNLAHNPSAPYSMIDINRADYVLQNNIIGTNRILWYIHQHSPKTHYITIGSTGEYNHTIGVDIEEGYFEFEHKGKKSKKSIFPRQGNSIYHVSKIASTYLIDYLARTWNLKCTDVMQSVVFGLYTDDLKVFKQINRCDTDDCFGTVINRFVVQALLGEPLTVFGHGKHQRGFISLNDSIQAIEIAINNTAEPGIVQTWNQLSEWHSIENITNTIKKIIPCKVQHIESPRNEFTGGHYYKFINDNLKSLGYKPTRTIEEEIEYMVKVISVENKRDNLLSVIYPKVKFNV